MEPDWIRTATDAIYEQWVAAQERTGLRLEIADLEWAEPTDALPGVRILKIRFRPYNPMRHLGGEFD